MSRPKPSNAQARRAVKRAEKFGRRPAGEPVEVPGKYSGPDLLLYGREAFNEYVDMLIALAGPDYAFQSEDDFRKTRDITREQLEEWLKSEWVQHDATRVLDGQEKFGPWPLILFDGEGDSFYRIRLFSPRDILGAPPTTPRHVN